MPGRVPGRNGHASVVFVTSRVEGRSAWVTSTEAIEDARNQWVRAVVPSL